MTKKQVLFISGVISLVILTLNSIGIFKLCGGVNYGSCMDTFFNGLLVFFPAFPLFLFALISFFLNDQYFHRWWRFARVATPLSMLLILLAPSYSRDWMLPIEKGSVALITTIIFTLWSILLLLFQSKKTQKNKKK